MSNEEGTEDTAPVYVTTKSHRWAIQNFRVSWQEGTPNFTIGSYKDRTLYIPVELIGALSLALEVLSDKIEEHA